MIAALQFWLAKILVEVGLWVVFVGAVVLVIFGPVVLGARRDAKERADQLRAKREQETAS